VSAHLQIPLDLSPKPKHSFDNLILSNCNKDAVTIVRSWGDWPAPILLLIGPAGSGKTHIGQAWAKDSRGTFIDDAHDYDEVKLFTLVNRALNEEGQYVLLSSYLSPGEWGIAMPDLKSRLLNVATAVLNDHDDMILEPILRKLFEDRGRAVTTGVVTYILKYQDRSVESLRRITRALDLAAQSQKVDLTRAFTVKELK